MEGGSGCYLVNDYSLALAARRRRAAWNTRSCLRCSAWLLCVPLPGGRLLRIRVPPGSDTIPRGISKTVHRRRLGRRGRSSPLLLLPPVFLYTGTDSTLFFGNVDNTAATVPTE